MRRLTLRGSGRSGCAIEISEVLMEFRHAVTARIWEPIEPIARGERYEDPLQAALQAAQLGTVDGGGSQLTKLGEVQFAELELHLANLDAAVGLTTRVLEEAGGIQCKLLNEFDRGVGAMSLIPVRVVVLNDDDLERAQVIVARLAPPKA